MAKPTRGVTVRAARAADAAEVARLAGVLGYPAVDEASVRARLGGPREDSELWVAELDGRVVGWGEAAARTLVVDGPHAELTGLVVDPSARRRGVARALCDAAAAWVRVRGLDRMRVRSRVERDDAHALYRALGFREVKTQRVFVIELGA